MLKRAGAIPVAVVVMLAPQSGAHADTSGDSSFLSQIECGRNGGSGCDIQLYWEQRKGGSSGGGGGGGEPAEPSEPASEWDSVDWDAVDWDAVDWDAVDWDAIDWDAVDYSGGDPEVEVPENPETLIAESMDSFELPTPAIASSPSPDSLILVTTPVWLWIDEEAWEPATAEANVPGLSLELTATPGTTRWDMGDGTDEVVCDGPGTAYDPEEHPPASESPDCGHIYDRSSQTEPDGTFTVTADISWEITWVLTVEESTDDEDDDDSSEEDEESDGEEGAEEDEESDDESDGEGGGTTTETGQLDTVVTSSEVDIEVQESQGLVTGGGE